MRKNAHTRLFLLIATAAITCLALAPVALAGKPSGGGGGKGGKPSSGGSGTISLVLMESTDGVAHHGQRVRFNVSTTSTTEPWVALKCYQSGALVAVGKEGYFERSLDDGVFGLYSGSWTGGAADCTATLETPQGAVLGSTTFHVYA